MGDKLAADSRNDLIKHYLRVVSYLNPLLVLTENVPGLRTKYDGAFFKTLCNGLIEQGFKVYFKVLNAVDYGVPQFRKRIFIVGSKKDYPFVFPGHCMEAYGALKSYKNCGDAIRGLEAEDFKKNHSFLRHSVKVISRYKLIMPGKKLPDPDKMPAEIRRINFGNTYQRLASDKPATTMVPGNNAFPIHPKQHRSLSPREAARIQTFPDVHLFAGNRQQQCLQVGNAVPPLLAAKLAESIEQHLSINIIPINSINGEAFLDNELSECGQSGKNNRDSKMLNCIDLFSGIGGFSIGLRKAGFNVVCSSDSDPHVAEAHKRNHTKTPFIFGSIEDKNVQKEILKYAQRNKIHLLVGGPPCQGFSIFGKRRFVNTRVYKPSKDPRNNLIYKYIEMAKKISPDWLIMENVPGLLTLNRGEYLANILRLLKKAGFNNIEYKIINCASFGAPQLRRRFLLIANKNGLLIPWPKEKYFHDPKTWQKKFRCVAEVLTDLEASVITPTDPDHIPPKHNIIVSERYSYIGPGEKMAPEKLPKHLKKGLKTKRNVGKYSKVQYRLHPGLPSPTLVPGHNAFPVHPTLNRTLTIREAARIQTIPDDVKTYGPIIKRGLQIGNAFPPIVAQVFGERIKRVIKNEWTEKTITKLGKYSMIS